MDNFETAPFYLGQRVVYTTGLYMPKNSIHVISDIKRRRCGCWAVEINGNKLITEKSTRPLVRCESCFKVNIQNIGEDMIVEGWKATSFKPIQESPFSSMTTKEVAEKELTLISQN